MILKVLEKTPDTETGVTLTTKGSSTIRIGSVVEGQRQDHLPGRHQERQQRHRVHQLHRHCERPTITAGSTAAKVNAYVKSGSAATVVYIDATAATTSVESSTKDVVFVKGFEHHRRFLRHQEGHLLHLRRHRQR